MADEPKKAQMIQMTEAGGDFLGLSAAPHEPRVVLQASSPINRDVVQANVAQSGAATTETRTSSPPTPRVVLPKIQPTTGTGSTK